jgi:hypothetical protein
LVSISNKMSERESLGRVLKGPGLDGLTVNQTKNYISLIRTHISVSVSILYIHIVPHTYHYVQTEAGGCILTSTILPHVVSNLSRNGVDVGIIPDFRMETSGFEYTATCFGDMVDFQIVRGPPDSISQDKVSCFTCLLILLLSSQNL